MIYIGFPHPFGCGFFVLIFLLANPIIYDKIIVYNCIWEVYI